MLTKDALNQLMVKKGILKMDGLSLLCVTFNAGGNVPEVSDLDGMFESMEGSRENLPQMICVGVQEMVDLNATNAVLTSSETEKAAEKWSQNVLTIVNGIEASTSTSAYEDGPFEDSYEEGEDGSIDIDKLSQQSQQSQQQQDPIGLTGGSTGSSILAASNPYVMLKQEAMVGLWVCLLCTKSIQPSIKNLAVGKLERGLATVTGEMLGNKGGTCNNKEYIRNI